MIKETLICRRGGPACFFDLGDEWARWRGVPLRSPSGRSCDVVPAGPAGRPADDRPVLEQSRVPFTRAAGDGEAGRAVHQPHVGLGGDRPGGRLPEHPGLGHDDDRLVRRAPRARAASSGSTPPRSSCRASRPASRSSRSSGPPSPSSLRTCGSSRPTTRRAPTRSWRRATSAWSSRRRPDSSWPWRASQCWSPGRPHYRDKGFTIDVSDRRSSSAGWRRRSMTPLRSLPDLDLARRYAYLFFFRAPVALAGCRGARPRPGPHHGRRPRRAGSRPSTPTSTASATASSRRIRADARWEREAGEQDGVNRVAVGPVVRPGGWPRRGSRRARTP